MFLNLSASSAYRSPGFKNSCTGHRFKSQSGQVLDISQIAPAPISVLGWDAAKMQRIYALIVVWWNTVLATIYLQDDGEGGGSDDDCGGNGHHDHENYKINSKSPETYIQCCGCKELTHG